MVLHAPSVWERRSLPALIKASLRNQIGLFLLGLSVARAPPPANARGEKELAVWERRFLSVFIE